MTTTDMSPVIFSHDIVKGAMFFKDRGQVRKAEVLAYWPEHELVAVRTFDCEGMNDGNKIYNEEELMTYFTKHVKGFNE